MYMTRGHPAHLLPPLLHAGAPSLRPRLRAISSRWSHMYIYIYIYTHIDIYTYIYIYICICIYI